MRAQLKFLLPAILCGAGLLCLLAYRSKKQGGAARRPAEISGSVSAPAETKPVTAPEPATPHPAAGTTLSSQGGNVVTLRSELASLKKEYERLLSEKQHEYEARRQTEADNQKLAGEKARAEATLSQLQADRGADTARFTKERDTAVSAVKVDNLSLSGKLQAAMGELTPLKSRETARAAAVKSLPEPLIVNP